MITMGSPLSPSSFCLLPTFRFSLWQGQQYVPTKIYVLFLNTPLDYTFQAPYIYMGSCNQFLAISRSGYGNLWAKKLKSRCAFVSPPFRCQKDPVKDTEALVDGRAIIRCKETKILMAEQSRTLLQSCVIVTGKRHVF